MAGIPSPLTVSTRQQRIAELARQGPQQAFTSLNHHLDLAWLHEAYRRTRKDGAVGVDGQTAADYEANLGGNLQSLLDRAKSGTYRAPPVRRVHIPKGVGSTEAPPHASSARTRNRSKPACSQTSSKIRPRSRGERCSRRAFVLIVRYGVHSFCGPQALAAQSLIWSRVILASSRLVTRRRLGAGDLRTNGSSSGSSGMGVSSRLEGPLLPPSSPRCGASARGFSARA